MRDKFFIGAYYGPLRSEEVKDENGNVIYCSENFATDKYYKLIADSGIRTITYIDNDYQSYPNEVWEDLQLAEKYGLELFVKDTGIHANMTDEQLKERLSEYNNYPSFGGIYVTDEPTTDEYFKDKVNHRIQNYYGVMQLLSRNDILGYMNMLPWFKHLGTKRAYRKLFDKYVTFCKTPLVSWDRYVFDNQKTAKDKTFKSFFWNLSVGKEYADKAGIPFYPFVQAGSQWNDEQIRFESLPHYPSDTQFLWNVNVCLLWGAKGIQYFPLIQPYWFAYEPEGNMDYGRNGVIGANGVPTQWYLSIQRVNKWIFRIEEILMQSEHRHILAKGYYPENYTGLSDEGDDMILDIEVSDKKYGTLIGVFDYQGKKVYMVLNYNHDTEAEITLTFDKKRRVCMIDENCCQNNEVKKQTCVLTAGAAAILIVE